MSTLVKTTKVQPITTKIIQAKPLTAAQIQAIISKAVYGKVTK